eukprot:scaffold145680_cov54-Cyclotella_meneghiniana.AAC.4
MTGPGHLQCSGVPSRSVPPGGDTIPPSLARKGGTAQGKSGCSHLITTLWEPDRGDTNPRVASVKIGGGHSGLGGDT